MSKYFKLVCTHRDQKWYLQEFQSGRARFGWSPPGMDLRMLKLKDMRLWSEDERTNWSYTKFLLERIIPGDRVVIQSEQPLRKFLIGEVLELGYDFTPGDQEDFNHVLHIKPLTPSPISVDCKAVSLALKHNLSKRGQYYEIYPEDSIRELDQIVSGLASGTLDLTSTRMDEDTLNLTRRAAKSQLITEISRKWPAENFERFSELLCDSVDYIEVVERRDRKKGWDLLIRIINPLTGSTLMDNIPVQCKNFTGKVDTKQPIEDLKRSVRNSRSPIAYLFILGQLSDDFRKALKQAKEDLTQELGRSVSFELVDEDRIGELFATSMFAAPIEASS